MRKQLDFFCIKGHTNKYRSNSNTNFRYFIQHNEESMTCAEPTMYSISTNCSEIYSSAH